MITGELKSKIDKVWEAFWTGGLSNPITVIEQMTYLLFIRRLDDIHTQKEQIFMQESMTHGLIGKEVRFASHETGFHRDVVGDIRRANFFCSRKTTISEGLVSTAA
jgi:hypothetical protein